jgi:hypothetical protein
VVLRVVYTTLDMGTMNLPPRAANLRDFPINYKGGVLVYGLCRAVDDVLSRIRID